MGRNFYIPAKTKPFITEWTVSGDATARTITLPLPSGGTYNCNVDWGDGSAVSYVNAYNSANRIHTYSSNGTYRITITGVCTGFYMNNTGDKLKLVKIISWGGGGRFRGFNTLIGAFYGCTNLTSIPTDPIPCYSTGCTSFSQLFQNCTSLSSVSANLFICHTAVTSLSSAFSGCTSLTSIPALLLKYNTAVTNLSSLFSGCTGVTSIPSGLFDFNTNVAASGFNNTFMNCSNISGSIPSDLFRYNTIVSTSGFNATFYGCSKITSIPNDLFKYNTVVSSSAFNSTFYNCTSINQAINTDLFRYNTAVSSYGFYCTFYGCSKLTSIPTDLFRYNTSVTDYGFDETFYGCSSLDGDIPVDLFRYNTGVTANAFYMTFRGCSKLDTIPSDLFKYNTLASSSAFYGTFQSCSQIVSIPTDLFRFNTGVTTVGFRSTFQSCILITTIPKDLFRYNTGVTTQGFYATFYGCAALTGAPADIFKYNTALTTGAFISTFGGCTLLASIGADLFRYNVSAVDFLQTFYNDPKIQFRSDMFYAAGEQTTRFLNKSPDFSSAFYRDTFTGVQGTMPDLWNCSYGSGAPVLSNTMGGSGNSATSLTNYGDIPRLLNINVAPSSDWVAGDLITGQTSAKYCTAVKKITSVTYWVNVINSESWTSGEIIGVTGNSSKLADQNLGAPTFSAAWR